ncbi:RNA helicase [Martelella endophytica]|uniref:DEAD-box ATP-dependent RNA helicase RhpA n=1 Tax=Martelella endophytica TaxID=1486262 RepID=A0A0D5LWT9_MAREN|nr:RNA helicase [Martelella endophytica]
MTDFSTLGLSGPLVARIANEGYEKPTPIQEKAIPLVLEGRDLMGLAQTGTGKTAAFGLPIIDMLLANSGKPTPKSVKTLILAPTRELVNQIAENLRIFARKTPLRVSIVVGGASINRQQQQLAGGTDILVATPGRLLDLLDRRALYLDKVRYLVLDEADQMLDLGFIHDLKKIASLVPDDRQTMLFSATMPKSIADLSHRFLSNPERVEVTPPGKTADKVDQAVHFVAGKGDKVEILRRELSDNPDGRAIVFLRTKHGAEKLMKHLESRGFATASIHGNKSQGQRERALKAFKTGEINVLVATDVAARGIDVPGVTHVYNYDLPEVADAYVHRIGRTARAGKDGKAIAFCTPEEAGLLRDIQKLTGIEIAIASGEPHAMADRPSRGRGQNRGGQNRGRGNGNGNGGKPARRARPQGGGDGRHGEARNDGGRPAGAKGRPQRRQRNRQGDRRQSA